MANAPYSGGFSPGAELFAVDGDFTRCDPCGPPVVSYPMQGDSVFSDRDIVVFDAGSQTYVTTPLGVYPNIQPWSANQRVMLLEQDFMVAQESYQAMRLNTPYDPAWSLGWQGAFPDGQPTVNLNDLILVREGALEDMGGGISKLRRSFVNVPPTRNKVESYVYTPVGYADSQSGASRLVRPRVVMSRVQFDYFVFDDWGVLGTPLFPNGYRLDASTGLYPPGLILEQQNYYTGVANAVAQNIFLAADGGLDDGDGIDPTTATIPNFTDYTNFVSGGYSSNGKPAEIIIEASCMGPEPWMGNIWERRTRFVVAQ